MNEIAIAHGKVRAKFSRRRTKARDTYCEGRFPATFEQIFKMGRESDRFLTPRGQPKKRANSKATKTCVIATLGTCQAPAKILFRAGQMQLIVDGAVVRFLINNETFRTRFNNRNVVFGFHRSDFDRDRGKIITQSADAFGKIIGTNEFWMLAGDEKELPETCCRKMSRFLYHFIDRKRDAQNWIFAGESAVTAAVDAFVGKIKRGEEPHGAAKMLTGKCSCSPSKAIKLGTFFGRNQG